MWPLRAFANENSRARWARSGGLPGGDAEEAIRPRGRVLALRLGLLLALAALFATSVPRDASAALVIASASADRGEGASVVVSAAPSPESAPAGTILPAASADLRGGVVLVLSGGGTKGFAHIGVMKVLERERIPIVAIVGTSMGSIMGGLYACGYRAEELDRIVRATDFIDMLSDKGTPQLDSGGNRPPGMNPALLQLHFSKDRTPVGPMGGMAAISLYNYLGKLTARAPATDFDQLPIPFAAVATDLATGDPVILRSGNLADAMRASMAIPGLFDPWPLEGKILVDGGLVANLPVRIARQLFPGHPVLAVDLSAPPPGRPVEPPRIRNVADVIAQTIEVLTKGSYRADAAAADLLIQPDVSEFGILDSSGYDRIIARGVAAAEGEEQRILALAEGAPPVPVRAEGPAVLPVIREIRVEGVPSSMAPEIARRFRGMVGHPLDLDAVNRNTTRLSRREDILHASARTEPCEGGAALVVDVVRRPAYELALDGYGTNLHTRRWIALTGVARDILAAGDAAEAEYRLGDQWGAHLRYFTPEKDDAQWGFALIARQEEIQPVNADASTWERYAGRIAYYVDNGNTRLGFGVVGERVHTPGQEDEDTVGPYLHLAFNGLDSVQFPTRGFAIAGDAWSPQLDTVLARVEWQAYLPWRNDWRIIFRGGFETGDPDVPAHRAYLGDQEELFSLAEHPLAGDRDVWIHLGIGHTLLKTWWGGLNAELFGTWGAVTDGWEESAEFWEAGLGLTIPGSFFNGRLLMVYDQDGEVTFGFSIGDPKWDPSPLP